MQSAGGNPRHFFREGLHVARSKTSIGNQSLGLLGLPPIANIDTEQTKPAKLLRTFWDDTLDEALRSHPWNFATRRKVLSPLAASPEFGYSAAFQLPSDWLRSLDLGDVRDYMHEGGRILCNASALELRYIYRVTDITQWDALFLGAFTRNLASKLAYPLTQSNTTKDALWSEYTQYLQQARGINAQEDPADANQFEESSLIAVRR